MVVIKAKPEEIADSEITSEPVIVDVVDKTRKPEEGQPTTTEDHGAVTSKKQTVEPLIPVITKEPTPVQETVAPSKVEPDTIEQPTKPQEIVVIEDTKPAEVLDTDPHIAVTADQPNYEPTDIVIFAQDEVVTNNIMQIDEQVTRRGDSSLVEEQMYEPEPIIVADEPYVPAINTRNEPDTTEPIIDVESALVELDEAIQVLEPEVVEEVELTINHIADILELVEVEEGDEISLEIVEEIQEAVEYLFELASIEIDDEIRNELALLIISNKVEFMKIIYKEEKIETKEILSHLMGKFKTVKSILDSMHQYLGKLGLNASLKPEAKPL